VERDPGEMQKVVQPLRTSSSTSHSPQRGFQIALGGITLV